MIRYFLHGGYITRACEENKYFYKSIFDATGKDYINILVIPFAREKDNWDAKVIELQSRCDEYIGPRLYGTTLFSSITEKNIGSIKNADIICIWGGDTQMLQQNLSTIPKLQELFEEKIVVGSSAGALIFSEAYYENDTDKYYSGLGWIPCGMICHWKDQYNQKEELQKRLGEKDILCIPECHFIYKEI